MRVQLRTSWVIGIACSLLAAAGCARFSARPEAPVALRTGVPAGEVVTESARQIPVLYDVDVLVVGGTSGAVTAAVAAAQNGARVFLAAPRPYLGDDICGTYRLWLEPGEQPSSPLAKIMFAEPSPAVQFGDWHTPQAIWHKKTAAHNTVVVDGRDQAGGATECTLWSAGGPLQAVRAACVPTALQVST